jgi:hypothetical protein
VARTEGNWIKGGLGSNKRLRVDTLRLSEDFSRPICTCVDVVTIDKNVVPLAALNVGQPLSDGKGIILLFLLLADKQTSHSSLQDLASRNIGEVTAIKRGLQIAGGNNSEYSLPLTGAKIKQNLCAVAMSVRGVRRAKAALSRG